MSKEQKVSLTKLRSKLTPNQRIFCDEYLVDRNGTRSYLKGYPNVKLEETAAAAASRLLKNVKIKAYIEARLAKLQKETEATVERILQEECQLAYSDIRKIFNDEGTTIPPHELPDDIAPAIAGIEITERILISGDDEDVVQRIYKYRFWDKGQALNRIEKHLGMHAPQEVNINYTLEDLLVGEKSE